MDLEEPKWVPKRTKMWSQNGPNGPQNGRMLTLGVFGRLGGQFGAISEASWGSLGGVRERLGRILRDLDGVWGASCARLGAAWGGLGTSSERFGGVVVRSEKT